MRLLPRVLIPVIAYLVLMFWYGRYMHPVKKEIPPAGEIFFSSPVVLERLLDKDSVKMEFASGKLTGPMLINFWASWCEPCKREFVLLDKFAESDVKNQFGVQIYAVAVDDDIESIRGTGRTDKTSIPVLFDQDREFARNFLLRGIPSTFLIAKNGAVVWKKEGEIESSDIQDLTKKLREIY